MAFLVYREKDYRIWGKSENGAEKAVPLQCNSERQIALTIPSARSGEGVPSKSQVSPIFWRTRMGVRREGEGIQYL